MTAPPARRRALVNAPVAWMLSWAYATGAISALVHGRFTEPGGLVTAFAVVAGLVGLLAFVLPHRGSLPWGRVATVALAAFATGSAHTVYETSAYEPSAFNFSVYLFAMLIVVGELTVGVAGGLVILTVQVWGVLTVSGQAFELLAPAYSAAVLAVAFVWVRFIQRIAREEGEFRTRAESGQTARQAAARELTAVRIGNALVSSGAHRVLERIANADAIDDDLLAAAAQAEASLRDHLRSPGLDHAVLATETSAARARGVKVQLFGCEQEETDVHRIHPRLAGRLAADVRRAPRGATVTIRQREDTVSVLTVTDDRHTHRHYDRRGSRRADR